MYTVFSVVTNQLLLYNYKKDGHRVHDVSSLSMTDETRTWSEPPPERIEVTAAGESSMTTSIVAALPPTPAGSYTAPVATHRAIRA